MGDLVVEIRIKVLMGGIPGMTGKEGRLGGAVMVPWIPAVDHIPVCALPAPVFTGGWGRVTIPPPALWMPLASMAVGASTNAPVKVT